MLDACVFDHTQTGGPSFVASATRANRAIREGVPLAVGREITVERDVIGRLEGKVREVVYPITLPARASAAES